MAVGIDPKLIGADILVVITPQTFVSGSYSEFEDASIGALSFAGRIENMDGDNSYATENITPQDSGMSNPVPYELSGTYNINEIASQFPIVAAGNTGYGRGHVLKACSRVSLYHKLEIYEFPPNATFSGTPSVPGSYIEKQTIYALMTKVRGFNTQKSKITASATFQLITVYNTSTGAEIANPAFS